MNMVSCCKLLLGSAVALVLIEMVSATTERVRPPEEGPLKKPPPATPPKPTTGFSHLNWADVVRSVDAHVVSVDNNQSMRMLPVLTKINLAIALYLAFLACRMINAIAELEDKLRRHVAFGRLVASSAARLHS